MTALPRPPRLPHMDSAEKIALEAKLLELEISGMKVKRMAEALGVPPSRVEKCRRLMIADGRLEPRNRWGVKGNPSGTSEHSRPAPEFVHEAKLRLCMMCKHKFKSTWPGERICKRCKGTVAWQSGTP